MANNQLQKSNSVQFAAVLKAESVQQQFKNALGEHKDAFVASLIDLYNGDKSLQMCNTNSLVCEALRAATLKLPLNKALGFAYIVVYNNSVKRVDENGNDVIARGAPHIIISVLPDEYAWKAEDGNTALAYFELSAHAHNVGCVWAGYFTSAARKCKPLRDALGIKDDEYIAGAQLFGNPIYKTRQITSRKPNNITYI